MDTLFIDSLKFSNQNIPIQFNSSETILQTFGYLILVIVLIYLIAFVFKKIGIGQSGATNQLPKNSVEILGQSFISQKEKVIAIKLFDTVQFILVAENHNVHLKEVDYQEFQKSKSSTSKVQTSFQTILNQLVKK